MPFSKITNDQFNAGALSEGISSAEEAKRLLDNDVETAKRAHGRAVYDLGPPDDPGEDRTAIGQARKDAQAARDALTAAEKVVQGAEDTLDAARAKRSDLDAELSWATSDLEECRDQIADFDASLADAPAMTDKERDWLAEFSQASDTPPSFSVQLRAALDKAERAHAAATRALATQDNAVSAAERALDDARAAEQRAAGQIETCDAEVDRLIARLRRHAEIATLKAAWEAAERRREAAPDGELSMATIMQPYDILLAEFGPALQQLQGAEGAGPAFGETVAALADRSERISPTIAGFRNLTGDEAKRRLSQLADLAGAMNGLADAIDAAADPGLADARKQVLVAEAEQEFRAATEDLSEVSELVEKYLAAVVRDINALDASDWATCQAAAGECLERRLARLQKINTEQVRIKAQRRQKRQDYETVQAQRAEAYQENLVRHKPYNAMREALRNDDVSMSAFRDMLDSLQQEAQDNRAFREENEAGEFFTSSQWREHFGMSGGSRDWGMEGTQTGTHKGKKWEVHYTVSNDAIMSGAETLRLRGAKTQDVFDALFIDNTDKNLRMHATFMIAGQDAHAHLYLGEPRITNYWAIPQELKSDIRDKLRALESGFVRSKKKIIGDKIKDVTGT